MERFDVLSLNSHGTPGSGSGLFLTSVPSKKLNSVGEPSQWDEQRRHVTTPERRLKEDDVSPKNCMSETRHQNNNFQNSNSEGSQNASHQARFAEDIGDLGDLAHFDPEETVGLECGSVGRCNCYPKDGAGKEAEVQVKEENSFTKVLQDDECITSSSASEEETQDITGPSSSDCKEDREERRKVTTLLEKG